MVKSNCINLYHEALMNLFVKWHISAFSPIHDVRLLHSFSGNSIFAGLVFFNTYAAEVLVNIFHLFEAGIANAISQLQMMKNMLFPKN